MFRFLKKSKSTLKEEDYEQEYTRRVRQLTGIYIDELDTLQEQIICAVGVFDKVFLYNGGINWEKGAYEEYFDAFNYLLDRDIFNERQRTEITDAIDSLRRCGRELEESGESTCCVDDAIRILRNRSVDWVLHFKDPIPTERDDDYIGHF